MLFPGPLSTTCIPERGITQPFRSTVCKPKLNLKHHKHYFIRVTGASDVLEINVSFEYAATGALTSLCLFGVLDYAHVTSAVVPQKQTK